MSMRWHNSMLEHFGSRSSRILGIAAFFVLLPSITVGCNAGRHSPEGFRLPPDGDVERGRAAFLSLGCNECHEVVGADLPARPAHARVPVVLGGRLYQPVTDGYLVTSIIYPSYQFGHQFSRNPKDEITRKGQPPMPHYAGRATVRQLVDMVAFLQSKYTVEPRGPEYYH